MLLLFFFSLSLYFYTCLPDRGPDYHRTGSDHASGGRTVPGTVVASARFVLSDSLLSKARKCCWSDAMRKKTHALIGGCLSEALGWWFIRMCYGISVFKNIRKLIDTI